MKVSWLVQRLYVVVVFTTCRFSDVSVFFYIPYRFLFAIAMAVAMAYYLLVQGMSSILYRSICLAALTVFVGTFVAAVQRRFVLILPLA